ncbi:MAG: tetratricopeptide repeat protein [Bacteroidales bacterium]|nr:tetratricopeptide repeat protein [Candidatus Latescibacterota bacterium]
MKKMFSIRRFKISAAAVVFTAVVICAAGDAVPQSSVSLDEYLVRGDDAFRRGMELDSSDPDAAKDYYRRAILNFEHIAEEGGVQNGKLYYNIGNAWFRMDDLGRAILNYKRAALFSPNDQNLAQNLEYARTRRVSRVEVPEREIIFKTLFFIHYDIPSRVRLAVFIAAFALVWMSAGAWLFMRRGYLKIMITVFSIVSVIFMVSLSVEMASRSSRPEGVVVAGEVIARKGDAETYQPSFTEPLSPGTEFRLLERRTQWWHIELEDGARCWIPAGAGETVINW